MEGVGGDPVGDLFGPFDGEPPGGDEEVLDHQVLELGRAVEAVGVEMDEGFARAAMEGEDVEGGACHRFLDTEAAGEALDEGGFARAEIAVEGQNGAGGQGGGEAGGEGPGFVGGGGDEAGAKFVEDGGHDGGRVSS